MVVVALAVLRPVLRALWWLLRALAWVAWRLTLLALAAPAVRGLPGVPRLRRLAWQLTLMAVGLSLTRGGRSFPVPRPGGRRVEGARNDSERGTSRRRRCAR